jgi:predicted nucleic acid-binding protein
MKTAEQVREFIKNRPYISEALEKNIVNLSELSRIIQQELNIQSIPAIKAALRRHSIQQRSTRQKREEAVLRLLHLSRLMILDNLSIVVTNKDFDFENKMKIKLTDLHYVYLVEKASLENIKKKTDQNNMYQIHGDCTALVIHSPEETEITPGVVAYLTSLLSGQSVYSLAFASCYTETTIVVKREDALKSYEILSKVVG